MNDIIFPLEELASYQGNVYAITVASARRAYQMVKIGDSLVQKYADKAVSLAARQLFTGEVKYALTPVKTKAQS